jgi:hypothetical protein
MTNATAMVDNWGFDQVGDNLFKASLTAWKNAGGAMSAAGETGKIGLASDLSFGLIPFLLVFILYIRTGRPILSIFVLGLASATLQTFGLISTIMAGMYYVITGFALTIYFMTWLKNR